MNSSEPVSLLVVDDDDVFRSRLVAALNERGFAAVGVATHADALREAENLDPECALVDLRMTTGSGLDLIPRLRAISENIKIVVLTGYGSIATAVEALRRGAMNYLTKPIDIDSIVRAFTGESGTDIAETAPQSLEQVEWEHINRVLMECKGNISLAAKLLGLHRRSLQRKLATITKRT